VRTRSAKFTDVALVENARQPPGPRQISEFSTPENVEISAVERSPKFINVTDVARSQKSRSFCHVGTTPGRENALAGHCVIWARSQPCQDIRHVRLRLGRKSLMENGKAEIGNVVAVRIDANGTNPAASSLLLMASSLRISHPARFSMALGRPVWH
jgi:hypothetical protein